MNDLPSTTNSDDDVFWTACRYVWNELSAAEVAVFEERLATDEAACSAVAEAVRLSAGLKPAPAVLHSVDPVAHRGRMLAAASCCASAIVAGFVLLSGNVSDRSSLLETAGFVDRWSTDVAEDSQDDTAFEDDMEREFEIVSDNPSAPDWMVAAVELATQDPSGPDDLRREDENL